MPVPVTDRLFPKSAHPFLSRHNRARVMADIFQDRNDRLWQSKDATGVWSFLCDTMYHGAVFCLRNITCRVYSGEIKKYSRFTDQCIPRLGQGRVGEKRRHV